MLSKPPYRFFVTEQNVISFRIHRVLGRTCSSPETSFIFSACRESWPCLMEGREEAGAPLRAAGNYLKSAFPTSYRKYSCTKWGVKGVVQPRGRQAEGTRLHRILQSSNKTNQRSVWFLFVVVNLNYVGDKVPFPLKRNLNFWEAHYFWTTFTSGIISLATLLPPWSAFLVSHHPWKMLQSVGMIIKWLSQTTWTVQFGMISPEGVSLHFWSSVQSKARYDCT